MFAPSVNLVSNDTAARRLAALAPMREAEALAQTLVALSGAGEASWASVKGGLIIRRQKVEDASAQGALDRLLARADSEAGRGVKLIQEHFEDSVDEIDSWIRGAEAFAAGPQSAGLLAEFAASDVGSAIVDVGLVGRELAGVTTETYSGRDNADVETAKDRAETIKSWAKWGGVILIVAAVVGGGAYIFRSFK